jgi:hypothetical protein
MLEDAISAIADVLRSVSANAGQVDPIQVIDDPQPALSGVRSFVIFEAPGDSVNGAHIGRAGGLVFNNSDFIGIEYHRKLARDNPAPGAAETRQLLDTTRDALWSAFQRNRFQGTVMGLTRIATDGYGPDNYGSDVTFGFRLSMEITHQSEATSGKAV